MNTIEQMWSRLEEKSYREQFVAQQVKRAIPFQIRAMLKARNWTQSELAERAGIEQGVISRAANPNYGNLSLSTIIRVAAGFDVAFIGKFVPFSELGQWFLNLSESELGGVLSFSDDVAGIAEANSASKLAAGGPAASVSRALPPGAAQQASGRQAAHFYEAAQSVLGTTIHRRPSAGSCGDPYSANTPWSKAA